MPDEYCTLKACVCMCRQSIARMLRCTDTLRCTDMLYTPRCVSTTCVDMCLCVYDASYRMYTRPSPACIYGTPHTTVSAVSRHAMSMHAHTAVCRACVSTCRPRCMLCLCICLYTHVWTHMRCMPCLASVSACLRISLERAHAHPAVQTLERADTPLSARSTPTPR